MSHVPKFGYQLFGLEQPEAAQEGYDLELDIYDVIGQGDAFFGGGVSAAYVLNALRNTKAKNVLVRINSPGGSVTEGFGIYNHLMEHAGKVTTRVDAMAGSMASIVMLAGEDREMAYGSTVMIHNPFAIAEGEANELRGIADMLDRQRMEMLSIYSKRTGLSAARVAKMVDATTWIGSDEALDLGFATRLTGRPAKAKFAAAAVPADIAKAPPKIRALLAEQAKETLAAIAACEQGEAPGSQSAMDEKEMKAAVEKALADAQAALAAVAEKDKEMASLKAAVEAKDKEIAELKSALEARGKGEFPPKEEDEKAQAVVAAAMELTGVKDVAKLEGALMALADAPKASGRPRAEVVDKLISDGKLLPTRRAWALGCSQQALDHYLEATGGVKLVQVSSELKPDTQAALKLANLDPNGAVTLSQDEIKIARTMGISTEKALELKRQQIQGKAS